MRALRFASRLLGVVLLLVAIATSAVIFLSCGPRPAEGAEGDEYELVLEKVGSAKVQADKALRDVLGLDADAAKELLGSMPATLKSGMTKAEADMLKTQILNAVGRGRVREQVSLRVRIVKGTTPGDKPKGPASKPTAAPGKGPAGKPVASVKRGDPPPEAQAAADLEKQKITVTRQGDKVTKVETASFGSGMTDDQLWLASAFPDLKEILCWDGRNISDVGFSYLSRLKKLDMLMILGESPSVTDEGLKHLSESTELALLSVESPKLTDKGLKNLNLENKPRLWSLSLSGSRVTDEGLKELNALPRLKILQLNDCPITDAGLKGLEVDTLESLSIVNSKVTAAGVAHLATFSSLDTLTFGGAAVTDEWLKTLPPALRVFDLRETKVTDAGLAQLKSSKNLSVLMLKKNKGVTAAGIQQLKQSLPELRVDVD